MTLRRSDRKCVLRTLVGFQAGTGLETGTSQKLIQLDSAKLPREFTGLKLTRTFNCTRGFALTARKAPAM